MVESSIPNFLILSNKEDFFLLKFFSSSSNKKYFLRFLEIFGFFGIITIFFLGGGSVPWGLFLDIVGFIINNYNN